MQPKNEFTAEISADCNPCKGQPNNRELVESILCWFKAAKPKPTLKDTMVQIGCHFEEIAEMAVSINNDNNTLHEKVNAAAVAYKNLGQHKIFDKWAHQLYSNIDKLELLDALCDQIVTALGVGYMMGFDMVEALREVNASNYSKFENGKPVFNEQGKIAKGKDYFKPNLTPYLKRKSK